jgi:hypothetical protein
MKLADLTTIVQWGMFLTGVLIVVLACSGCGGTERPLTDAPAGGAGAELGQLGSTLIWWGGIGTAAGVALWLVSLAWPPLGAIGAVFRFAAIGGAGVTATGASIAWLADNPVVMVAGIVASLGAVVWWYYPRWQRVLSRRLDGKV